jgi:hypothetical protein
MDIIKKKTTLSNYDLEELGKAFQVSFDFIMRDQLTVNTLIDGNYILNLDTSNGSGTHYVAFVVDNASKTVFYFDSYAAPPPNEAVVLWTANKFKVKCNAKHIQDLKSRLCGFYAIYFLLFMTHATGRSRLDVMKKCINTFITDDYKNDKQNDKIVKDNLIKFLGSKNKVII